MIRTVLITQLMFFICYGSIAGIAIREWKKSAIERAEISGQTKMLISLPLAALKQVPVEL